MPVRRTCYYILSLLSGVFSWPSRGALPTAPENWRIEVVASAPEVLHPSVVCAAPDGRVFVAEDPMDIRLPANSANGRILCFHPDGRRTVFATNLFAVFGMQYLEGKLYVLHNPRFSVFRDEDGIGKDREELIESTNPNPWALDWNDHVPANFKLGMDGYFYVAVGDKGMYGAVGRDGKRLDLHGGGIVRLRPDGTGLEIFCTGVRNILDVAMDVEDEIFTYDNTDEHQWMGRLTHMVEGGFYGYPFDFIPRRNYTLWMMADFGGGAATGTFCYNEHALPREYHGNLFLADFGKRQILRVRVEREGATFRVASKEDFFRDPPEDFRPVGIALSPDGLSIYICDWQHRDTKEDTKVGRLLKVTYQGLSQAAPKPPWWVDASSGRKVQVSDADLIRTLSHPSHAVRITAQRLLAARKSATAEVLKLARDRSARTYARWHAIWAIGDEKNYSELLNDSDPGVRRQVLRRLRDNSAGRKVELRLTDSDAAVRFQAAAALGRMADPRSVPNLLQATGDQDSWVRFAISEALNRIGREHPESWRSIAKGLTNETIFNALRETYNEKLLQALVEIAPEREAAVRLATLMHRKTPEWKGEWWAYHPFQLTPPAKTIPWQGTARANDFILAGLSESSPRVRGASIEGVAETKDMRAVPLLSQLMTNVSELGSILTALKQIGGSEAHKAIINYLQNPLGGDMPLKEALEFLDHYAAPADSDLLVGFAKHSSDEVRAPALNALARSAPDRIFPLLKDPSSGVRSNVVKALAKVKTSAAVEVLLETSRDPELRETALFALAQTPDVRALDLYVWGLERGLAAREAARKAIRALGDGALARLKEMSLSDEAKKELAAVYKQKPDAQKLFANTTPALPEEFLEFALKHNGNADAGRAIFFNAQGVACGQCHTVRNQGGRVGPDLTTIGAQFPRRELAESILYPSKAVREGYQTVMVETKDEETLSGLLKGETADELQLVDSAGQVHRIAKNEIITRKTSELSLMPEGLQAALTLEQFANLLAYLETLK
jgi:putative membrane-bound dehydrogenase-like protein